MDHLDRITLEPEKRGGKPCIRGLRITVYDVLEYLASGMTEAEILEDFPDLEREEASVGARHEAVRIHELAGSLPLAAVGRNVRAIRAEDAQFLYQGIQEGKASTV